ncbi:MULTISPECIES: DUF6249 domain-containing protein [Halomicrobium]|uniref:DUF6249 domain-containing protein n=2 Tax=Halomicrobium mukohataei TaxID=57705 RepID=C7NYQ0_HALMD|nr:MULTISPECIES: DUF6249 domain-containing protein [Halomicrobium]ACV48589.1 hypothetical protein Hmuk_2481 [Halomicrobium mukohataei DSM 12286]QCD66987.1 hypothetical protein E5139_15540 [Halomicrobium mukohataei]QFR21797.1 hypothetical protein GBQ70_15560 [Halomicrobium sp. ZPS1]
MVLQVGLVESTLVLGFVFVVILLAIGLSALAIWVDHRKEMALIEQGRYPEDPNPAWVLAAGFLLFGYGIGSAINGFAAGAPGVQGAVPAFLGLAALAYYFVRRREGIERARSDGD